MHSFAAFLVRTDPSPIAYAVAAAAVLVLRRRRRRRLAGDDKRAAALLPFSQPTLGGGGGAGAGGGGQAVTVEVPAQHLVPGAALGTLPSVEERMEDEFAAPLATFPTRPSSASPAGAATLLGLASALPASPLAATSTAGLSQPQTPSLSSAGESLGSSTGRPSRWVGGWVVVMLLSTAAGQQGLQAAAQLCPSAAPNPTCIARCSFVQASCARGRQRRCILELLHANEGKQCLPASLPSTHLRVPATARMAHM